MIKIKWLKEWKERKIGDISQAGEKSAKNFVGQGFAEYVIEDKPIEKKGVNIKEGLENLWVSEDKSLKSSGDEFKNELEESYYSLKENLRVFDLSTPENIQKAKEELYSKGFKIGLINRCLTEKGINPFKESPILKELEEEKFLFNEFSNKTDFLKIVEEFVKIQPIYYDNAKLWWFWSWKDKCWIQQDETDLLNALDRYTRYPSVNSTIKNELLEAFKRIGRRNSPSQIKKTWIQFKDIIYDIGTGEQIKAGPEYFVTNPIPWNIGEMEETPEMDKLFEQWTGKDYVKTLYQIIAYCCLCDYPIHRLFCLIGEGLNGKGTFLRLLTKFVGIQNCCSTELDVLLNSRFEVTRLFKKLVCQMGETNFNEMKQTSMLKKLVGGDLIGFEFKNKTPFEDNNYAKIIISTNNLPATTDKTIGFYRRWMIVDFPNRFNEKIDILTTIPDEEYENLARKVLFILKDLLDTREFHLEGTIEERAKKFEDKSNPFDKFIKEFTEEDANGDIWKFEFEKRFNAWCKENKFREFSEETIGRKMKEKGYHTFQKQSDWLIDGMYKRLRIFGGLKWKE